MAQKRKNPFSALLKELPNKQEIIVKNYVEDNMYGNWKQKIVFLVGFKR